MPEQLRLSGRFCMSLKNTKNDPSPCQQNQSNAYVLSEATRDVQHVWAPYLVKTYARLLILEYYADYVYLHNIDGLENYFDRHNDIWESIGPRRLELLCFYQDLFAFAQCHADKDQLFDQELHTLARDAKHLLDRYEYTYRIFEDDNQITTQNSQMEVMGEQLDEAKESKNTAISLGRLPKLAFVYVPPTFVCTLFGMNLSILGQGTVRFLAFVIVLVIVCFLTFLPVILNWLRRPYVRARLLAIRPIGKIVLKLAWRSPVAAFWYTLFDLTHNGSSSSLLRRAGILQGLERSSRQTPVSQYWREPSQSRGQMKGTYGSDKFWRQMMHKHIFSFIDQPDWEKHSFVSRYWHIFRKRLRPDTGGGLPA